MTNTRALPRPRLKPRNNPEQTKPTTVVNVGSMDYTLYLVVIVLVCIGVIMVFSASYVRTGRVNNDAFFFLRRNGLMAIGGFIVMNFVANVYYGHYKTWARTLYVIVVGLMLALLVWGVTAGGATRWLPIPGTDLNFQPSEIAKAATIFIMAWMVSEYENGLRNWVGFLIYCAVAGLISALVFETGFSSGLIVAVIGFGMIFIASPHILRFLIIGIAGIAGAVSIIMFGQGFRIARVAAWQDPFAYADTVGFQIIQSLYAIASGGVFGLGIGNSRQATFVPEAHNDIIFAIIAEELGLIGAGLVMLLFGIFIWRGIKIALNAPDTFSAMAAVGIVFAIAFQAIINIAVVTNAIPNTGVTLPFISYGGTSLIVSMALAGVLLNISRYSKDRTGQIEPMQ
ncbi:MAG: putative lipid II flippase FtsW [Defluviitaleaceae bacterium]|nr:putative lipid II flippase FtsW [Defluviitaleaceae bacterium]MCL2275442.1 putative lipid II flippase FtsW [Defluviitaleaceae bacterium]